MSLWLNVFLFLATSIAQGNVRGDDHDLAQAAALQKVMQRIIQQNEPSIACILVSRSEGYHEVDTAFPDKASPGRLGAFDPEWLKSHKSLTQEKKLQYLKHLDLANPNYVPQSFGSGVVVDAAGLVLTNYHVIQDATKLYVRLPGGKGSYADIHAADPRSDLAVLRLLNPNVLPLKAISIGDADKLGRGQFLLTLSNPFAAGFRDGQPSASWGILSNIRRRSLHHLREEERVKPLHYYGTLLQTDARLHLGCSGGALLNLEGEMVGLLTSVAAIQGGETPGGFAIPLNPPMQRIIEVLKRGEEVEYGFLGVGFDEKTANAQAGITLSLVGRGSPADIEGRLREGDTLVAVDGQPIHDSDDIFLNIGIHLTGSKVKLSVRRGGRDRVVDVTLAKLYVPGKRIATSLGGRPWFRGMRVDHTSLLAQQPPRLVQTIPTGVLVSEVQPNSTAERAHLKPGDIVTQVNHQPIGSPAAFYQAVANLRNPVELTLYNFQPNEPQVRVFLK